MTSFTNIVRKPASNDLGGHGGQLFNFRVLFEFALQNPNPTDWIFAPKMIKISCVNSNSLFMLKIESFRRFSVMLVMLFLKHSFFHCYSIFHMVVLPTLITLLFDMAWSANRTSSTSHPVSRALVGIHTRFLVNTSIYCSLTTDL